jgi:hypothetical protein
MKATCSGNHVSSVVDRTYSQSQNVQAIISTGNDVMWWGANKIMYSDKNERANNKKEVKNGYTSKDPRFC